MALQVLRQSACQGEGHNNRAPKRQQQAAQDLVMGMRQAQMWMQGMALRPLLLQLLPLCQRAAVHHRQTGQGQRLPQAHKGDCKGALKARGRQGAAGGYVHIVLAGLSQGYLER
jgi:hypothetical protein